MIRVGITGLVKLLQLVAKSAKKGKKTFVPFTWTHHTPLVILFPSLPSRLGEPVTIKSRNNAAQLNIALVFKAGRRIGTELAKKTGLPQLNLPLLLSTLSPLSFKGRSLQKDTYMKLPYEISPCSCTYCNQNPISHLNL